MADSLLLDLWIPLCVFNNGALHSNRLLSSNDSVHVNWIAVVTCCSIPLGKLSLLTKGV